MKTTLMFLLVKANTMSIALPSQIQQTIDNITTAGQVIGLALSAVFFVVAAIQHMRGTEESIDKSKKRIVAIIVGIVLCAGCTVIKQWIVSMMAF